jgi:hypothetical protein
MDSQVSMTPDKAVSSVDSHAMADILALALKLQAQGEEMVSTSQIVEMGRELGIHPEYVHEALRLKGRGPAPATSAPMAADLLRSQEADDAPARVTRTLVTLFAVGMLPVAWDALARDAVGAVPPFALLAAAIAGWSAGYPRLARVGGALACPLVLLVSSVYTSPYGGIYTPLTDPKTLLLALLSLCPLCSSAAAGSAWLRRRLDRLTNRVHLKPVSP